VNIVSVPYGDYSISPGGALQNGIQENPKKGWLIMQTKVIRTVTSREESAKIRKFEMIIDSITIVAWYVVFVLNQYFDWSPRVLFWFSVGGMAACFIHLMILLLNPSIRYTRSVVEKVDNSVLDT